MFINGYKLEDAIHCNFPTKMSQKIGVGFCFECAALTMISLRSDSTARIVHGIVTATINDETKLIPHAWVERGGSRKRQVIDLYTSFEPIDKNDYYEYKKAEVVFVSNYTHFWKLATTKELHQCILKKETSYIWPLLSNFRPDNSNGHYFGFNINYIPDNWDEESRKMRGCYLLKEDGQKVPITQEIIDSILAPTR